MAAKKKKRRKTADERRTDVAVVALIRNLKLFQDAFCEQMLQIRHGVECINVLLELRAQRAGGKPIYPAVTLRLWRLAFQGTKAGVPMDDPRTLGEIGLHLVTELERLYGYPHTGDLPPAGGQTEPIQVHDEGSTVERKT